MSGVLEPDVNRLSINSIKSGFQRLAQGPPMSEPLRAEWEGLAKMYFSALLRTVLSLIPTKILELLLSRMSTKPRLLGQMGSESIPVFFYSSIWQERLGQSGKCIIINYLLENYQKNMLINDESVLLPTGTNFPYCWIQYSKSKCVRSLDFPWETQLLVFFLVLFIYFLIFGCRGFYNNIFRIIDVN